MALWHTAAPSSPATRRRIDGTRITRLLPVIAGCTLTSASLLAQPTTSPVPPIDSLTGAVVVNVAEFAAIPDMNGVAARVMLLVDEPGTRRLFVNDMRGPIYSLSYDGHTVARYIDINDSTWHGEGGGR